MNTVVDRKRLFKILTHLVISIFLVNCVAVRLYWYYSIWYFDMPMHFFGGLWVGLALIWFLSYKNSSLELSFKLICQIILGVLLIGFLWEVFEILVNNIIAQNQFNTLDTISDIFFDLAGGTFAVFYFFFHSLKIRRIMPTGENII
jgi:hypothetical protein